jgi:hypothetical protein
MSAPMRMRQSLAEIEAAFVEEIEEDRSRRERLQARAERRERQRHMERANKQGSMRFAVVLLVLIGTAVAVVLLMFQALYWVTS